MTLVLSSSSSSSCLMTLLLILVILSSDASAGQAPTSPRRSDRPLVLSLIHSDSIVHQHLIRNNSSLLFDPMLNDFVSPLGPDTSDTKKYFYVKVKIGSQRVVQTVAVDTGSSLTWVSCAPSLYSSLSPYDPEQSSTYESVCCYNETCKSRFGERFVSTECGSKGQCRYHQQYVNKLNIGSLGRDSFWWGVDEDGKENFFESTIFGCSRTNVLSGPYIDGVLALGNDSLSFLRQADRPKFGHCISNISDPKNFDHQLLIGFDLNIDSSTPVANTPITVRDGKYTLLLKSITYINIPVQDDPTVYSSGMILDTGSTLTFLPQVALDKLLLYITGYMNFNTALAPRNESASAVYQGQSMEYQRICYNGRLYDVFHWFPEVRFTFDGDAALYLQAGNIFQQYYDDLFCLAIFPSDVDYGKIILGNLAMQYNYFVYDTSEWKLSFGKQCCAMDPSCFPDLFD